MGEKKGKEKATWRSVAVAQQDLVWVGVGTAGADVALLLASWLKRQGARAPSFSTW